MFTVSQLIEDARIGNINGVREALDSGINPNEQWLSGQTALHLASTVEIVHLLLEYGANINSLDQNYETPLHWAVKGTLKNVECLVENGANLNAQNFFGETPLHFIVKHVSFQIIGYQILKYLIEKGSNINAQNRDGCTPLHKAITCTNLDMVKCLIRLGADPLIRNKFRCDSYDWCSTRLFWYSGCLELKQIKKFLADYKMVQTCFDLWCMDSNLYSSFIQWLPEEMSDDVMGLITGEFCSMRVFLYDHSE